MGRKKTKTPNDDDDVSQDSDYSGKRSANRDHDDEEEEQVELFDQLVERLGFRTASDREQALKEMRVYMHANPDVANEHTEASGDLISALSRCIRNGSGSQALALQVAQLTAVFFAGEECVEDVTEPLAVLAIFIAKSDRAEAEEVCEAIRLLTVCHLTNPLLDLSGDDVVDLLYQIWNANAKAYPSEAFSEAISCWVLCATTYDTSGPNAELDSFFKEGQKLVNLIGNLDYDISCAALEGVGLMYESASKALSRPPPGLGRKDPDALLEVILSENDKSVKKAQRKNRKELARKVQGTMDGAEDVNCRITIGTQKLEFEGWKRQLQIDFLRDVLLSGLTAYLKENQVVRDFLNISHLNFGQKKDRKDRKAERKAQQETSREKSKNKTMSDHKKSSAKMRSQFCEEE